MKLDAKELRRQAEDELKQEARRKRVDEIKAALRVKKPWWHKIFPFKVTITKR
jgi:hypothetical protein